MTSRKLSKRGRLVLVEYVRPGGSALLTVAIREALAELDDHRRLEKRRAESKSWIVELDGEFLVKFRTNILGRWTRVQRLATRWTLAEALCYERDWKKYAVRVHWSPAIEVRSSNRLGDCLERPQYDSDGDDEGRGGTPQSELEEHEAAVGPARSAQRTQRVKRSCSAKRKTRKSCG